MSFPVNPSEEELVLLMWIGLVNKLRHTLSTPGLADLIGDGVGLTESFEIMYSDSVTIFGDVGVTRLQDDSGCSVVAHAYRAGSPLWRFGQMRDAFNTAFGARIPSFRTGRKGDGLEFILYDEPIAAQAPDNR